MTEPCDNGSERYWQTCGDMPWALHDVSDRRNMSEDGRLAYVPMMSHDNYVRKFEIPAALSRMRITDPRHLSRDRRQNSGRT